MKLPLTKTWRPVALVALLLVLSMPATALASDDGEDAPDGPISQVVVTAQRLDVARANIQANLGASTYALSNDAVENRPGGETINLDQILLQMPGVTEDGFGQLHVRGDRGDLEYRINNVILPEGLSDLGDMLSTRMADQVELVTGALPAQYGLHAGGIVNITTKSGAYLDGQEIELYGGSHSEFEPAFELGGSADGTDYFATGNYLTSDLGIASPDGSANPLHDHTSQIQGFAFADHVIDAEDRVSVMLGTSTERFQIPNPRGLNAQTMAGGSAAFQRPLIVNGVSSFPSDGLNSNQRQSTQFAVLSYLHTSGRATLQVSGFARYSRLVFTPDRLGELLFHGISQRTAKRDSGAGVQADALYRLAATHTLRAGLDIGIDRINSDMAATGLPVDALGRPVSDRPQTVSGHFSERETRASVYLQDEWTPLKRLTVNFGLRFDTVDAVRAQSQLSPRINAVWSFKSGTTVHAGYARDFIPAPEADGATMASLLAGTTGAPPTAQGSLVRSETGNYYDLGVQQTLGAWKLGLDGYWRDARNLIDDGRFGVAIIRTPFNYAEGRIRGIELSATYANGPLTAWSNLSVARAQGRQIISGQSYFTPAQLAFASGHFVPLTQDQTYTASAGASYRWHALQLSGTLLYGSGFRRTPAGGPPNSASLPAHAQVNLAGVYHLWPESPYRLDLRIDAINIFDAKYEILDSTGLGAGTAQWGAGRGVFLGVEQSF